MVRADLLLVERGLAPSRNRAQELIHQGQVFVFSGDGNKRLVTKPSQQLDRAHTVKVEESTGGLSFVSRGGYKLKGALDRGALEVQNKTVLDIGISTGGFTDCLLRAGAERVIGIDVGHDQLAPSLRNDPRVVLIEGVNARDLTKCDWHLRAGDNLFDLIVIDVSFISLTLVLPEAIQYLKESAPLLALVKPQFEVGRKALGKNGIVKDVSLFAQVEEKIRGACVASGMIVEDYFESSIEGGDGNKEFFILARSSQLTLGTLGTLGSDAPHNRGTGPRRLPNS